MMFSCSGVSAKYISLIIMYHVVMTLNILLLLIQFLNLLNSWCFQLVLMRIFLFSFLLTDNLPDNVIMPQLVFQLNDNAFIVSSKPHTVYADELPDELPNAVYSLP